MNRPSGNGARKITDANQVFKDSINPPINPHIAKTKIEVLKPGKFTERTMRAGK